MTIGEAFQKMLVNLKTIYDGREAANIADLVMENIAQQKRVERFLNKKFLLNKEQQNKLEKYLKELLLHKPVQYVLHEAWFAGMKLYVDENVLIPRPETAELVGWIISDCRFQISNLTTYNSRHTILDIGTGSGCIAIALSKKIVIHDSPFTIHAIDILQKALVVAKKNAAENNAEINFFEANILDENDWGKFEKYDVIISNPPYIKQSEAKEMRENVLSYEPRQALFVEDNDALIFYKKIAEFGLKHLNKNGKLFFEINEMLGNEVCELLEEFNYNKIELKKDLQDKDRMIKAVINL